MTPVTHKSKNFDEYARPSFIPKDIFRSHVSPLVMKNFFKIDSITPAIYINRMIKRGKPIPNRVKNLWRPRDLVMRAKVEGHKVEPIVEEYNNQELNTLAEHKNNLIQQIHLLSHHLNVKNKQLIAKNKMLASRDHDIGLQNRSVSEDLVEVGRESIATREEIIDASGVWQKPLCGVYFLIKGEEIIYVGQSVNIVNRLFSHSHKEFDRYSYVLCRPECLNVLESMYIHMLRPELNFSLNGQVNAPYRSLDKMITESGEIMTVERLQSLVRRDVEFQNVLLDIQRPSSGQFIPSY